MMNKQEIEIKHLEQFMGLLHNDVKSFSINPTPEPDFTLKIDEKSIGVEHTRLFLCEDIKGDNIVIHNKVASKIMNDAQAIYLAQHSEALTVTVSFYSSYGLAGESKMLSNKDIKKLSQFIADFVSQHLPDEGHYVRFHQFDFSQGKYILPDKIRRISILHKYSCWSMATGGIVPSI